MFFWKRGQDREQISELFLNCTSFFGLIFFMCFVISLLDFFSFFFHKKNLCMWKQGTIFAAVIVIITIMLTNNYFKNRLL